MSPLTSPNSTRTTHRPATVVALLFALFMAAMEMTVVSTAMPTVVGDLGGIRLYSWVFTAYMLAATVTVPIYGKLADLYGRKPIILFGVVVFLIGSVASGQARSIEQLIAFRALQGLGAGAMQPITMTIIGDLFDVERRAKIQGLFGGVWGAAGIIGPLLGGYIVSALSWRWVFYINVLPGLLCMGVLIFAYHESVEKRKRVFDVAGTLVLTTILLLLLAGSGGGARGLAMLAIAGVLTAVFIAVEKRAAEPMLPIDLFSRRVMAVATVLGTLLGGAMIATVTFVPLHVQAVLGGSAKEAGRAITPMLIGWPVASAISGRLLVKVGFRPLILTGLGVLTVTSIGLAVVLSPELSLTWLSFATGLFGVGMGLANTALIIAVQSSVAWKQRGVATASTMFFRTIGGTLAVGALGAVIARELAKVPGVPPEAANALLGPEHGRNLAPELVHSLAWALEDGLHTAFWAIAALAVIAAISGLLFPRIAVADHADAEVATGAKARDTEAALPSSPNGAE
ncbi:MAG: MFS transporter [Myxococcales bacterium]|nr:MFS transporter [Myxococcales bacterium]